jgi:DnaK suppressor protein
MKKADMKVYKQRLVDLRARLRGDVTSLAEAALGEGTEASSMPIHMAELGSENFEQEFTLSLMASEEDTLELIELALQRIEAGTFGQCLDCEGAIPKTRLNALPYTPMCVKCASNRDQNLAS